MLMAEAELKAQIDTLLERARNADGAEKGVPELDIPGEIAQREAELECDPDDKPKGERYKREFGVPGDKMQDNLTDPDSRIMKGTGGGLNASYNAQTAVDGTAHIIVIAGLTKCSSDAGALPVMLRAVKDNLGSLLEQALADTGNCLEAVFERLAHQWLRSGDVAGPRGQPAAALRSRTRRAAQRLDQERAGVRRFSLRGLHRVKGEWKFVCSALNMQRMAEMQPA